MKSLIVRLIAAAGILGWAMVWSEPAQGQARVDSAGHARTTADTTLPTAGRSYPGTMETAPVAVPQAITDGQIAAWLGTDNRNEIVLSQIGAQRAQNPLVREFAQRMIREHSDFDERMRQIAGLPTMSVEPDPIAPAAPEVAVQRSMPPEIEAGRVEIGRTPGFERFERPGVSMNSMRGTRATGARDADIGVTRDTSMANVGTVTGVPNAGTPAGLRAEASANNFIGQQQSSSGAAGAGVQTEVAEVVDAGLPVRALHASTMTAGPARMPSAGVSLLDLRSQIARHELQLLQRDLAASQGPEFDRAFMRDQVRAHLHMLAALRSMRDYASPDLQTVLDQGAQTTERHLQHARAVMSSLDSPQAQTAAATGDAGSATARRR